MGVNNKQRRAAKQRKKARQQRTDGSSREQSHDGAGFEWDAGAAAYGFVDLEVTRAVRRLCRNTVDDAGLLLRTEALLRAVQPHPRELVDGVLADLLARLLDQVSGGGWGRADLEQLVIRSLGERHLPLLRTVIDEQPWSRIDGPDGVDRLASGLAVAAALASAPLLEGDHQARGAGAGEPTVDHPKLAQARALLAKAESTPYDEEAEALTAKAQELISRYSLGRLVERSEGQSAGGQHGGIAPSVRRLWLDAPYVRAKAILVHEVAVANRCRVASADTLGFCLVVGDRADIDVVELLVTSLLAQADSAMLRHGRRVDHGGRSRTRSFRQSFLVAYAARVGQRLREATAEAVSAEGAGSLPVLRDHEQRVADAFSAMVPHTVAKPTTIGNHDGWVAGHTAADLAQLDVGGKITEHAG